MKKLLIAIASTALLLASGCSTMLGHSQRHARSTSLVEYLYPTGVPPAENSVPVLNLPLTVGVAFLPSATGAALPEEEKLLILQRVRERFEARSFVREIVPIPDYYISAGTRSGRSGFDNLAALQRLYQLDLVALVSYDQVAHRDNNELSLTYLTIVGSMIFPGTRQDVSTIVDLAVVHPATRTLVLRAAGMDSRTGTVTELRAEQLLRQRSAASLRASAAEMIGRFDAELLRFEDSVRKGTARVQIANPGGAGSLDGMVLVLAAALFIAARRRRGLLAGTRASSAPADR